VTLTTMCRCCQSSPRSVDSTRTCSPLCTITKFPLLYSGLPTRSKFWFLQSSQPDVVCCEAPNCHGVETEEHLFLSCGRVDAIWHSLLPCWRRITRLAPGWKHVLLGLPPGRLRLPSDRVECLKTVWIVLCSVVVHHVWRTRNIWVFEQRALPPQKCQSRLC
jgi:hypothetical protein